MTYAQLRRFDETTEDFSEYDSLHCPFCGEILTDHGCLYCDDWTYQPPDPQA